MISICEACYTACLHGLETDQQTESRTVHRHSLLINRIEIGEVAGRVAMGISFKGLNPPSPKRESMTPTVPSHIPRICLGGRLPPPSFPSKFVHLSKALGGYLPSISKLICIIFPQLLRHDSNLGCRRPFSVLIRSSSDSIGDHSAYCTA